MLLRSLINDLEVLAGDCDPNLSVSGLAYHSGKVKRGDLFVCIRGYKTDGHLYLEHAVSNGAVAAVVETLQENINIPQLLVTDSRLALAILADQYFDHPSQKINLTGVTATNGKTSTTYMINSIFAQHGLTTGLIGTVIIKTGNLIRPAELTTPESLDLHAYFQEMVDQKVSHAVMEVSSSGLELKRVGAVDFNLVILNNISREHIDLHGSFQAYYDAKASLIRSAGPEKWAILNLDCPLSAALKDETAASVLTYSLKESSADCFVSDLDLRSGRAKFKVTINRRKPADLFAGQPKSFTLELSVLGLHSVYNAMAATLAALLQKIPVETISQGLKSFKGVERRFELIFEDQFMVIDDHFANSGNINVTLRTLQLMSYSNLSLVYAIRGSRGPTVNRENAQALASWAPKLGLKKIIATMSSGHVGEKDNVTAEERQVFAAVMAEAGLDTEIITELPEAIAQGLATTRPGDVLLLAGCQGMDYGAAICLKQIAELYPHLPQKQVFAALKNRVAGV